MSPGRRAPVPWPTGFPTRTVEHLWQSGHRHTTGKGSLNAEDLEKGPVVIRDGERLCPRSRADLGEMRGEGQRPGREIERRGSAAAFRERTQALADGAVTEGRLLLIH